MTSFCGCRIGVDAAALLRLGAAKYFTLFLDVIDERKQLRTPARKHMNSVGQPLKPEPLESESVSPSNVGFGKPLDSAIWSDQAARFAGRNRTQRLAVEFQIRIAA